MEGGSFKIEWFGFILFHCASTILTLVDISKNLLFTLLISICIKIWGFSKAVKRRVPKQKGGKRCLCNIPDLVLHFVN